MPRVLPSWFENVGKRQLESPKVYPRNFGLLPSPAGVSPTSKPCSGVIPILLFLIYNIVF
jgi:hypothetical protein